MYILFDTYDLYKTSKLQLCEFEKTRTISPHEVDLDQIPETYCHTSMNNDN
ncbi:protein of unknown function [Candidatus Nitrosocosmicus franklandus]|uniref:Uncharacterized protein n=1 Tax=Candidatus Nitrosocosmicus franklandianus TaxID=1798806 RepID=A0A484IBG7_9ARCH|nr:protein of unknown function [Candidatus Nitrosocosmicus franklandus]